jgi:S1-C subfamily serine protease
VQAADYASAAVATPSATPRTTVPAPPAPASIAIAAVTDPDSAPHPSRALEDVVARAVGGVVMVEAGGSRGTGFFVAPDLVVTNDHVVGREFAVTLRLHDTSTRSARVERTVPAVDLALLRTASPPRDASPTVLRLGRSDAARVGQEVIAIGSALGLQSTVTRGIVSAKRQSGQVLLLQTDAAINPGNSGGPLLDRAGTVLGVTTAKMGGAAEGLGFAVAAEHVIALVEGRPAVAPPPTPTAAVGASPIVPPVGSGTSSMDARRAANLEALERDIQQLAANAAQIDAEWSRFQRICQPRSTSDGDRAWFALASSRTALAGQDANCPYWLGDLENASRAFGTAMRGVGEAARRAGLLPGDLRTLRRRYRLDWTGFDR